jgi:hypothetical protein
MKALTGKGKQALMAAVLTFDTGKAIAQIAAIKITVIDLLGYAPSAGKKFMSQCTA